MNNRLVNNKVGKSLGIISLLLMVHHFGVRPWMLSWGAPEKIQGLTFSGDRLTGGRSHTRAVLIHARPEKIWPWIMQLGQERGGFYSYSWLENIILADMKNSYELKAELQAPRKTGDIIWLASKEHYKGKGYQVLAEVIPEKSFVMVSGSDYQRILNGQKAVGSWSIYLHPENETSTWLIARSAGDEPIGQRILRYFTFEIPHFIMEQKMLRTIKQLAEK
jgi:hypothetical protein